MICLNFLHVVSKPRKMLSRSFRGLDNHQVNRIVTRVKAAKSSDGFVVEFDMFEYTESELFHCYFKKIYFVYVKHFEIVFLKKKIIKRFSCLFRNDSRSKDGKK